MNGLSKLMNKAARNLQSKTANIVAATDIDKADRNKLEQLIDKHGPVKVAAAGAAWAGGLTGAVLLGHRLLTPEQEAAVLEEKESNGVLRAAAVGLTGTGLMALGAAALLDDDADEYLHGYEAKERMIQDDIDRLVYEQEMRDGDVYSSDVSAENSIRSRRPRRF